MSETRSENITWHKANLTHDEREAAIDQRGCVVWFTGFSGSGKSTVARKVEELLLRRGKVAYVLDGDNLRMGLNRDLGFAPGDRTENIRRVGAVAQLFADAGLVTLTAFISPYRADRAGARAHLPEGRFIECHVATPLEECERRDPKGLYVKARAGEIGDFTGISAPYEPPEAAEIVLHTVGKTVEQSAAEVVDHLERHGFLAV
ncbi:MAG: adenylyl-sulfate kinase [Myxococcota bacterium]